MENIRDKIFKLKYAINNKETFEGACYRVASYIGSIENKEEREEWVNSFFRIMVENHFLPGGRVIANSGTGIKNLMNCFVLPVDDSREGIYGTLKDAAEIFAWGGGIGYNFSNIREEGADVKTTGGKASGPLSFMSLFDQTGEVISQASRRGAQMGMMDIDHPDVERFIDFKSTLNTRNKRIMEEFVRNYYSVFIPSSGPGSLFLEDILRKTLADDQLTHFNISVVLTDDFMNAVLNDDDWNLISRVTGEVVKKVKAKKLLQQIAERAHESGDPGVFFFDRANEDNMVKYLGDLKATNPCITGDTLILTVYEGPKTIKELAEREGDTLVYTWNPETKLPEVAIMFDIEKTRESVETVEVEFDSGLKLKCTPDHHLYTFRGDRIKVEDLEIGQSVRAFSMGEHPTDGHLRAHGWVDGKTQHQYVARLVWYYFNGPIENDRMIIHHKDFNPHNNRIENLELVTPEIHNSIHYADRRRAGFYNPRSRNHKVINIKPTGKADVYNGTVDGTHTYIIADPKPISGDYSGIVSANCGEIPLLPNEPCCLGSLNLHAFFDPETESIAWDKLAYVIRLATRFLDNVQTLSEYPIDAVNTTAKGLRRLGLGVMGWADLLAELEIPYDSDLAFQMADHLSWFISYFSVLESINLSSERGSFPLYDKEKVDTKYLEKLLNRTEYSPKNLNLTEVLDIGFRNVANTAVAPTGSIALLSEVNSGIEPFFALAYRRNITEGVGNIAKDSVIEINPILFKKLKKHGYSDEYIEKVKEHILKFGSLEGLQEISDHIKSLFKISSEINWKDHIRTQQSWQHYFNNSISKTINLSNDATTEDIYNAIIFMWESGLKGGTIYRDGSKLFQILNKGV